MLGELKIFQIWHKNAYRYLHILKKYFRALRYEDFVIDMVKNNKFDNDRDAARVLTSIPFHIRRPNKQLVEEFENNLLNWGGM